MEEETEVSARPTNLTHSQWKRIMSLNDRTPDDRRQSAAGGPGRGPSLPPAPAGAGRSPHATPWKAPPVRAGTALVNVRTRSRARDGSTVRIALLGGFRLTRAGQTASLTTGAERLLALVAMCPRAAPRCLVAGTLWPDLPEERSYACLRSALARLHGAGRSTLDIGSVDLGLAAGVQVDLWEARTRARSALSPGPLPENGDLDASAVTEFSAELLPGWYDDWALREAEEWRQLRLHALESLAGRFTQAGRYAEATVAACAAVRAEPLRESAQAALISVHLAEGNQSEALRAFERYRHLLRTELGLNPTPRLLRLVAGMHPVTSP